MNFSQYVLNSMIGPLHLVASDKGLSGIHWKKQKAPLLKDLKGKDAASTILAKTAAQLDEYFKGKRQDFDLPLDIQGTDFQRQVWAQLRKIPYGKTCSYQDIARKIKNKKACRAVGTANGRNPISIVVPCHRVIASGGGMGGYAGGLSIKEKLLELEQ